MQKKHLTKFNFHSYKKSQQRWYRGNTHAKSLQLCPTLHDPMDCSPPGSSVHGILQARIVEWVAFPFFLGFPDPGTERVSTVSPALQADYLLLIQDIYDKPTANIIFSDEKLHTFPLK